jgi:putative transposase
MKYPKKMPLVLTDQEQAVLEQLATSRTVERRCGERATIILQLAAGRPKQAIAQHVHLTRKSIYTWYDRWLDSQDKLSEATKASDKEFRHLIEDILADTPRPGTPGDFSAEQVCQIMALACQKPEELGLPFTTWTPSELARMAVTQGIVPSISPSSVGRFLKSGRVAAPQKSLLAAGQ